jgi:hypothetical protein
MSAKRPLLSPAGRIVALCVGAAILYGLVHDQITARVCVEYFSVAHPKVINTDSPTLLGLYWGVAATWWVGLLLGLPLALACRGGEPPFFSATQMVRPVAILLACVAGCALLSGVAGYQLASRGAIDPGSWAKLIPPAKHAGFMADAYAHMASYLSGFFGGIVVIVRVVRRRRRMRENLRSAPTRQSVS